jgi:hypothetical protein
MNLTTNSGDASAAAMGLVFKSCVNPFPLITVVSIRIVPSEVRHKLALVVTVCYQGVAGFCVPSQPVSATTGNKR